MSKRFFSAVACVALTAGASFAQELKPRLEFEVASVKVAELPTPAMIQAGKLHAGIKFDNARVDIGLTAMLGLLQKAFDVKQYQISGPDWMLTTPYDIVAKMPEGSTKEQMPQMLLSLLEDRFGLKYHREKKEQSVFALVVDKAGTKLVPYKAEGEANGSVTGSNELAISGKPGGSQTVSDGTGLQQTITPSPDGKSIHVAFTKVPLATLCDGLFRFVGRPIVDLTGLKGDYNAALDISMADIIAMQKSLGLGAGPGGPGGGGGADSRPADMASDSFGNSVVESLKNLGLKLESRKTPVDMIIIDKLEKTPTAN
jgi:uncharacterized protein (TIGR03435 family)